MYPRVILKLIGLILQDASAAAMILFTLIEALGGLARLGLEPNRPMGTTVAGLHAALCYHLHAFHIYIYIRRPRPTQGGARQGIRHFPPTIWKLATATATAAAAVLFCAMVFSRPGPTFLQQPAAGAAGRQQQSSQQSRSR